MSNTCTETFYYTTVQFTFVCITYANNDLGNTYIVPVVVNVFYFYKNKNRTNKIKLQFNWATLNSLNSACAIQSTHWPTSLHALYSFFLYKQYCAHTFNTHIQHIYSALLKAAMKNQGKTDQYSYSTVSCDYTNPWDFQEEKRLKRAVQTSLQSRRANQTSCRLRFKWGRKWSSSFWLWNHNDFCFWRKEGGMRAVKSLTLSCRLGF